MTTTFKELAAMLSPEALARVKASSENPTLALCRVAREGSSTGAIAGVGKARKNWSAARVAEVASLMNGRNTPVYRGHSTSGGARRPIGNIVRCFTIAEDSRKAAFAVIHITDTKTAKEAIMKKLDTASIEADVTIEKSRDGLEVTEVERVTGLALGSSENASPGFPDAKILAAVRENDGDIVQNENAATLTDRLLATKNLNQSERAFVRRRVLSRLGENADDTSVGAEASAVLADLAEAKSIYRKPATQIALAEKPRGPHDYADPAHNDLIP